MNDEPMWFLEHDLKERMRNFRPGDDAIAVAIGVWLAVETGQWLIMFMIFFGAGIVNLVGKLILRRIIKRKMET